MDILEFSKILIKSGELDPIYNMLATAEEKKILNRPRLMRWCLAYWLFYHAGAVSDIVGLTENTDFWPACRALAAKKAGERGGYRIHFRGEPAVKAIDWLSNRFPNPLSFFPERKTWSFGELKNYVGFMPQFGPAITFKIADMFERVLRIPVNFSGCELSFYDAPVKGAQLLFPDVSGPAAVSAATEYLKTKLKHLKAPPYYDRPIGIQEIETILCGWKSFQGKYKLGDDGRRIRREMAGHGRLAHKLVECLPEELIWP